MKSFLRNLDICNKVQSTFSKHLVYGHLKAPFLLMKGLTHVDLKKLLASTCATLKPKYHIPTKFTCSNPSTACSSKAPSTSVVMWLDREENYNSLVSGNGTTPLHSSELSNKCNQCNSNSAQAKGLRMHILLENSSSNAQKFGCQKRASIIDM